MHPYREKAIPDPAPPCEVLSIYTESPYDTVLEYRAVIKTPMGYAKVKKKYFTWRFTASPCHPVPKECVPALQEALTLLKEKRTEERKRDRKWERAPWVETEERAERGD
jgi:hypothetical protein